MVLLHQLIEFVERWLGSVAQVLLIFFGIFVFVGIVVALWDRRIRLQGACVGIVCGLALLFHAPLFSFFIQLEGYKQVAIIALGAAVVLGFLSGWAAFVAIMRVRYAILWIGVSCGLGLFGLYVLSTGASSLTANLQLVGILIYAGFVTLLLFYFSLVLTKLEKRLQQQGGGLPGDTGEWLPSQADAKAVSGYQGIKHRLRELFSVSVETIRRISSPKGEARGMRGSLIGVPLVIVIACGSVLMVGALAPQPMIGDEVTHYYMMVEQSHDISEPNFFADIPQATGAIETRRYPHSFLWHYCGALLYKAFSGNFFVIQLYQMVFLLQLLVAGYLLAKSRGGIESRSALIFVLVLGSLPLSLFFSVAFYQDVPMTAQVLTAFYLLDRRRWFLASCFMAFAVGLKVTAVLFYPAFFLLIAVNLWRDKGIVRALGPYVVSVVIVLGFTFTLGKAINMYANAPFYPQEKLEILYSITKSKVIALLESGEAEPTPSAVSPVTSAARFTGTKTQETAPLEIANHPGDLRIPENFLVFGGMLLWLVLGCGLLLKIPFFSKVMVADVMVSQDSDSQLGSWWLYVTGGSFLLLVAYFSRSAPDARFFLPGIPFVVLPFAESLARVRRAKLVIGLLAALALMQGGYVLTKTYTLRNVSTDLRGAIKYLSENTPDPPKILMYPEGNYRLFPVPHEWYLGYRLREFWRADNDKRLQMLEEFGVGAIVVKKNLIATVGPEIRNLGVYPYHFVAEIDADSRFEKVFENREVEIFVPVDPPQQEK